MIEQQPQPGDRVRVTYEATVDVVGPGGMRVVLRGGMYFCQVPPGATVEALRPPTLAERMAALADELEEKTRCGYYDATYDAVRRIREELAATAEPPGEQRTCGARYSHGPRHPVVSCTRPADHEAHNWADLLGVDQ